MMRRAFIVALTAATATWPFQAPCLPGHPSKGLVLQRNIVAECPRD